MNEWMNELPDLKVRLLLIQFALDLSIGVVDDSLDGRSRKKKLCWASRENVNFQGNIS